MTNKPSAAAMRAAEKIVFSSNRGDYAAIIDAEFAPVVEALEKIVKHKGYAHTGGAFQVGDIKDIAKAALPKLDTPEEAK